MGTQNESSFLFSLKELQTLEDQRIEREREDERRRIEAVEHRRREEERLHRERDEAKSRAVEDARRDEERRQREDAARLEAIRLAEIERARLDAENAGRLERLRHEQEHAQRVASLQQDRSKKKLLYAAIISGTLLVTSLAVAGITIRNSLLEQERLAERVEALATEKKAVEQKLSTSIDPKERDELQRQLDVITQSMKATPPPRTAPTPPARAQPRSPPKERPPQSPTCNEHDPLCGMPERPSR